MVRTLFKAALILIAGSGVVGCSGEARFVKKDATGGIVAIPSNSMLRPLYRDEAISLIKEQHNASFTEADIISEQEVTVGEETRNDQTTDRTTDGKLKSTVKTDVTTTTPIKEYWIEYKITPKPAVVGKPPVNSNVRQASNTEKPTPKPEANESTVFPAGGIPRQVGNPSMSGQGTGSPYGMRNQ